MHSQNPILILAPRMTDDSQSIWRAGIELGWTPQRLQGWRVPDSLSVAGRKVAIYGEPLFAEAVADQLHLSLLEPPIDWLTTVPRELLHRLVETMTLQDARGMDAPAFVKPADGKIFEPKVYATGAELPTEDHVDGDILVLRSDIVDFRLEVRCFVRENRVVTLSPYWREGTLANAEDGSWPFLDNEDVAAREFADRVLADSQVSLPPACTLDVGRLADGQWAIIEANPVWGAGLYGCEPKEVLHAIRLAIVPKTLISDSDKRWVSKRKTA
jgi:hypothetical protein